MRIFSAQRKVLLGYLAPNLGHAFASSCCSVDDMTLSSRMRLRPALLLGLSLGTELLVMVAMLALDLRDLWYKTRWVGPDDTFAFSAVGSQSLQQESPLSSAITFNRSTVNKGEPLPRASGWSSFLSSCEELFPASDGPFFLHAMGINCTVGPSSSPILSKQIFMASSMRVDSIAWAACRSLRNDRKPAICRAFLAQDFVSRYNIIEKPKRIIFPNRKNAEYHLIEDSFLATPVVQSSSPAEEELLELLEVISNSTPSIDRITCVEGFIFDGAGHYSSSLFACGSAHRFESAFVGVYAKDLAALQQDKAWLTADSLRLMGMSFLVRENSISQFRVDTDAELSVTKLSHTTIINFSSSGLLYTVTILIDIALLIFNLISTIEIASVILYPLLLEIVWTNKRAMRSSSNPFGFGDYRAILSCPLFRSTPIVVLMMFSQLISWMLVLPNAVIWTWTESANGKIQAYLSTLRIWVVPLIIFNLSWNLVVFFNERVAYFVTFKSYVRIPEVMGIASVVAFVNRAKVFAIASNKYREDNQRVVDATSFQKLGLICFGNTFPGIHGAVQTTSSSIIATIYGPLVEILLWTLMGIAAVGTLRFLYFTFRADLSVGNDELSSCQPSRRSAKYERLPIESLLNLPIRARSFIRNSYLMEIQVLQSHHLRPSCFVEHGIIVERHKMRTRRGFFGSISFSADAEPRRPPEAGEYHAADNTNAMEDSTDTDPGHQRHILSPLR